MEIEFIVEERVRIRKRLVLDVVDPQDYENISYVALAVDLAAQRGEGEEIERASVTHSVREWRFTNPVQRST
jgi:hypothetical protein